MMYNTMAFFLDCYISYAFLSKGQFICFETYKHFLASLMWYTGGYNVTSGYNTIIPFDFRILKFSFHYLGCKNTAPPSFFFARRKSGKFFFGQEVVSCKGLFLLNTKTCQHPLYETFSEYGPQSSFTIILAIWAFADGFFTILRGVWGRRSPPEEFRDFRDLFVDFCHKKIDLIETRRHVIKIIFGKETQ